MSARQILPYTPTGSVERPLSTNPPIYRAGSLESHRTPTIVRTLGQTGGTPTSLTPVRQQPTYLPYNGSIQRGQVAHIETPNSRARYYQPIQMIPQPVSTPLPTTAVNNQPSGQKIIHRQPIEKSVTIAGVNSPERLGMSPEKDQKKTQIIINLENLDKSPQTRIPKKDAITQMTPDRHVFYSPIQAKSIIPEPTPPPQKSPPKSPDKNFSVQPSEVSDSNLEIQSVSGRTTQVNSIKNTQIFPDIFQPTYEKGEYVSRI